MKKNIYLIIGIVILFICMSVVPSITGLTLKESIFMNLQFNSNTLYVGGSGPGNFTKIQDAIDNSSDGDTVFVYNGTYYENIEINKFGISLVGEDKENTIIDSEGIGYGITVQEDMIYIADFSIRNSSHGCMGIIAYSSCNLQIRNCNIYKNSESGIHFSDCHNIIINNCFIYNNEIFGISMHFCHNIVINNCFIYNNEIDGISISESHNITITECNIDNTSRNSIVAYYSYNITITNNIISNSKIGIYLLISNNNDISRNSFFNNGLFVESSYDNNVENNTVNGKLLVYLQDETDYVIDYEVGQVILVNCDNIVAENLNLSNTSVGIELFGTYNSAIINSDCLNNNYGIIFYDSSGNIIIGNKILNNDDGIHLDSYSCNNIIYHNNFIDNSENAYSKGKNIWDDGKYGNYWSDYLERYPNAKPRLLKQWMWNISYVIPGHGDNKDNCPLVNQWPKSRPRTIPRDIESYSSYWLRFLEKFLILSRLFQRLGL